MTDDVNAERIQLVAKGNDLTEQAREFYETNRIKAAIQRWHKDRRDRLQRLPSGLR